MVAFHSRLPEATARIYLQPYLSLQTHFSPTGTRFLLPRSEHQVSFMCVVRPAAERDVPGCRLSAQAIRLHVMKLEPPPLRAASAGLAHERALPDVSLPDGAFHFGRNVPGGGLRLCPYSQGQLRSRTLSFRPRPGNPLPRLLHLSEFSRFTCSRSNVRPRSMITARSPFGP